MLKRKKFICFMVIFVVIFTIISPAKISVFASSTEGSGRSITPISINESTVPDENFRNYLINDLSLVEIDENAITNTKSINVSNKEIKDLTGIEYFDNLETLDCSVNKLESLVLTNSKLKTLICGDNEALKTLNIEALTELLWLDCGNSIIEELNLSKNTKLKKIYCNTMKLKKLDVSHNNVLDWIIFSDNEISELIIGKQDNLVSIIGDNNLLTEIDVTDYPKLLSLELPNNLITSLDLSKNPVLEALYIKENQLVSLDLSNNPEMLSGTLDFAIENQKAKTVNVDNLGTIDMSLYDVNFDGSRVSDLSVGTIENNKIINAPTTGQITYKYYAGKVKDGSDKYVDVTLDLHLDTFNIAYHLDGGSNDTTNPATYKESDETFAFNNPTKTGYIFEGWYDQATGGSEVTQITKGSTGDKTLYARWSVADYSISYDNLFGSTTTNPIKYTIETNDISLVSPTNRKDYKFDGWYDQKTGGSEVKKIAKGSTGNKILYARWKGVEYNIVYNNLFGTNSKNPRVYTIDDMIELTSPSDRTGYKFDGWYDQIIGGNKITTIAKGSTGNVILYAQWKKTFYEDQNSKGNIIFEEGQDDRYSLKVKEEDKEIVQIKDHLQSVYDIYFLLNDNRISMNNTKMIITLKLKEEEQGFKYYKVAYINSKGEIVEEYVPVLSTTKDEISFEVNHLSYYAVYAWNETKTEDIDQIKPEPTKPETKNPKTGDSTNTNAFIYLTMISGIFIVVGSKKKSKK